MVDTTKQIQRYSETIVFKDKGLDGYRIEFPDTELENEFGATFITFTSFDDCFKFYNIDNQLYFLYSENYHSNSCMVRDDEMLFYNNLKVMEKIIKDCENRKIVTNDPTALYKLFMYIQL